MVASSLPPEVLFHRFFQLLKNLPDQTRYRGKQDLDKLPDNLRYPLAETQLGFNKSFARSHDAMEALSGRSFVVHFDYVDSSVENALAFEHGGYKFIGITVPLIELILERCEKLVQSVEASNLLNLVAGRAEQERARGGLFMTQLIFVAAHEFGHHLGGHAISHESEIWNEIMTDGLAGSLENHAQEYFADAYGVYLTLGSLIDGAPRRTVLELLGQASTPAAEADEVLLSAFLLSTNAFFLARSPLALNKSGMFSGTHPPSVARINGIIQTVRTWCSKSRPALNAWTTQAQLEKILAAAAGATGRENWREQVAFLASPDGKEYYERLEIPLSKMMQPPSMAAT